uniref:Uncharacterized protein n=1 Tax=Oryza meridionalis TaxID=40149 RepID=A0A0E0DG65_9ORYZ
MALRSDLVAAAGSVFPAVGRCQIVRGSLPACRLSCRRRGARRTRLPAIPVQGFSVLVAACLYANC